MKRLTAQFFGRPVHLLLLVLIVLSCINIGFYALGRKRLTAQEENIELFDVVTSSLGLTDLCVATEARYTRHPAISDRIAPFMDHPGALEHFPTGSFWGVPPLDRSPGGQQ